MSGITVSEKRGVNPMVVKCFVCGEETGEVALLGKLKGDTEAPRSGCLTKEPCDKCKGLMRKGVILISVRDLKEGERGSDNPYRTGGWVVVKEEALRQMVQPEGLADEICRKRVAFVPNAVWKMLGLDEHSPVRCE